MIPVVNTDRCVGSGECERIAPDAFVVGDDGCAEVAPEAGQVPAGLLREAVRECPTGAISLD